MNKYSNRHNDFLFGVCRQVKVEFNAMTTPSLFDSSPEDQEESHSIIVDEDKGPNTAPKYVPFIHTCSISDVFWVLLLLNLLLLATSLS